MRRLRAMSTKSRSIEMTDSILMDELIHKTGASGRIGGLIGLLVGDALGVPYEFHSPEQLPAKSSIEMDPPAGFRRSYSNIPAGTWSDDGAQALCLLSSLIENDGLIIDDFAKRLLRWYDEGYMAVDGIVFDCGIQTSNALSKIGRGESPLVTGGRSERENGNGSLMRVLPLALWHQGSDVALVQDAHLQSLPTHAHARSQVACAFYCLVARAYLNGLEQPWKFASKTLSGIYQSWPVAVERPRYLDELGILMAYPHSNTLHGSGYVLDCLWSAEIAMHAESYEEVVKTAISFGNDTDTTACVAGGLAGIRHGMSGIPSRWSLQLRGASMFYPLAASLQPKLFDV